MLVLSLAQMSASAGTRMTVRNGSGSQVGRIDSDGTVRNSSGSARGRFDGYSASDQHAAAAYLFFFVALHKE